MKKKAILLVDNTDRLVNLAQFLVHDGWEILSAGATAAFLKSSNIPVTIDKGLTASINTDPNFIQYIYGITNNTTNRYTTIPEDMPLIDLVCINIKPVFHKLKDFTEVENPENCIDLKRISLLRTSAKNFANVVVLTDPDDYEEAIHQLKVGQVVPEYRLYLAGKALNETSAYDAASSAAILFQGAQIEFPNYFLIPYEHITKLRHGTNKQQHCHIYSMNEAKCAMSGVKKLQGPELAYPAFVNCFYAWKIITAFIKVVKEPLSVPATDCNDYPFTAQFTPQTGSVMMLAVKNNTPVSAAFGSNVLEAYWKAYNADKPSFKDAFIACSAVIDENGARELLNCGCNSIVAPDYTKEAKEIFSQNQEISLYMASKLISDYPEQISVDGGLISQQQDLTFFKHLKVVTQNRPNQQQMDACLMGILISKYAKSDAAVVINDFTTIGICSGQVNKSRAVKYAMENAKEIFDNHLTSDDRNAEILVSDSVIHFDDRIRMIADLGIKTIIQAGGDETDEELINFCNEHGISMIFTGINHLAY